MTLQERIEKILDEIKNPTLGGGLIETNTLKGLHVDEDGKAVFVLEFPANQVELGAKIREEAIAKVSVIPGVRDVSAVLTADKKPRPHQGKPPQKFTLPGVKHIILVGSGKGGVGKSTTSVNLACALSKLDLRVGLLDTDIYGPSLPRMMGVNRQPKSLGDNRIEPVLHQGIQCMSMGFMIAESMPAIWRGPMVQSAILQMMNQVEWDNVDILVLDLPPGTGDIPITLIKRFHISGAVVVSTPQDISLIDARKAINMFKRMETPILGLVENMSYFKCPHCNERSDIFHHGGARKDAEELAVPFLGEVPLDVRIREAGDEGAPVVLALPECSVSEEYMQMAKRVCGSLQIESYVPPGLREQSESLKAVY